MFKRKRSFGAAIFASFLLSQAFSIQPSASIFPAARRPSSWNSLQYRQSQTRQCLRAMENRVPCDDPSDIPPRRRHAIWVGQNAWKIATGDDQTESRASGKDIPCLK